MSYASVILLNVVPCPLHSYFTVTAELCGETLQRWKHLEQNHYTASKDNHFHNLYLLKQAEIYLKAIQLNV